MVNSGQKILSTRWAITIKDGNTKARIVVTGFEEQTLEFPKDGPTVGKGTMRLFLSTADLEQWTVKLQTLGLPFYKAKHWIEMYTLSLRRKVKHQKI